MKKIFFLIAFTLQFSLFCFSQTDTLHHYTDAEVLKLSNYVKELESKSPPANLTEPDFSERGRIADLLNRTPHDYSNAEIINLAAYIKHLENPGVAAFTTPADSITHYSNPEIEKFAVYINDLEKRIASNSSLQSDPEEKSKVTALLNNPSHEYSDSEIITLANFIKHLEKLDSLNTIAIVKAHDDSLALAKNEPIHTEEKTEIEKNAKLVFFDFDRSSLTKESYGPLEDVIKIIKNHADVNFVVEGYCDSVGSSAYNLSLSKRRAGTVRKYLISKGIPSIRVTSVGYGEENPIAPNATEEGRAKNRRVEIKAKQ